MDFVNRENELEFLKEKWVSSEAQLVIIYGKRRVGKTELAIQFAKDKPHLYFLSEKTSNSIQLIKFSQSIKELYHDEFLSDQGFKDWETAFKYIAGRNQRVAIIIDEFGYLVEQDSAIPSIFQRIWDLILKNSKVFLILMGSSISMMERTALHYRAPLYGRRTGQLLIKPFKFNEVKKIIPLGQFEEWLSIYSIVGGMPSYLNKFKVGSWLQVIKNEILKKGQPLYEEVEFILREELREPGNYFVILEALSLGKHKLSELINETGFEKTMIARYLSILNRLQITEKEVPVTEKMPEKSRKGHYRINDNFFSFWFRFVFRNRSLLEENRIDDVAAKIKVSLIELQSKSYERLAGSILCEAIANGKIPLVFENVGRWWDKNEEIDLVAVNPKTNEILLGEVKWSNKSVGTNIYGDLKQKASLVEWGRPGRKEHYVLFSKSGFTSEMEKIAQEEHVYLFHLDQIVSKT